MTARRGAAVLGALARAVPRPPIVIATGAALAGVAAGSAVGGHPGAVLALQAATVALAGAAVTLLEEPRAALDAVPTTLGRRRTLLLAAGLPLLALAWIGLLAVGGVGGGEAQVLTLQLAAVTSLALGFGAYGGDPARALIGVALAFGTGRILFGPELFPAGTEAARWSGAAGVWAGAAGTGLLLLAAFSRDAAARR